MTLVAITSATKAITSAFSNLYGNNICHSPPTYMAITSAMAITSV